jgi:hypothetical protein
LLFCALVLLVSVEAALDAKTIRGCSSDHYIHKSGSVMTNNSNSYRVKAWIAIFVAFFAFYVLAHDTLIARPYLFDSQQGESADGQQTAQFVSAYVHDCPFEHGGVTFDGQHTIELLLDQILQIDDNCNNSIHSSTEVEKPVLRGPPHLS